MITFTTSTSEKDLLDILELQKRNLPQNLPVSEMQTQGFVTVSHTLEQLNKMNEREQHLIIKEDEQVIGYLLAMTKHSRNDIAVLVPMFELFGKIIYKDKLVSDYNYLVVGQVCIDKNYRGIKLLDKAYSAYKEFFKRKYDFAITEIALNNPRSLNAHKRVGFLELYSYTDNNEKDWSVVIWDWKDPTK